MYYLNKSNITNAIATEKSIEQKNSTFVLALHNAIKNNELDLAYQPRYDITSGKSSILEALVRWPRKGIGTLYPDAFIDEAIQHGLIYELDLWVFKQACHDLINLRANICEDIKISINITPQECESFHHTQKLIHLCQVYGLKLSDFEFEITESTQIKDFKKVHNFCTIITELGATLSLDDFGTRYSPLHNICELPVNYIKIDRSFTQKIGYGGRSEVLINHLIDMAHEMSIKVVAEGIEHAYQRDHLVDMGCDQLQGFYMCRPTAAHNFSINHINMFAN